jgi:hypothetical protein
MEMNFITKNTYLLIIGVIIGFTISKCLFKKNKHILHPSIEQNYIYKDDNNKRYSYKLIKK